LKIEGNKYDNYAQGKICARGQSGLSYLFNPDRITKPLIRVEGSRRGEWKFREATWEEAFQYIMKKVMEKNIQPHEWIFLGGWHGCAQYRPWTFSISLLMDIINVWGAPIQNCVGMEHLGIHATLGYFNTHEEMVADYENARFIFVVRSNGSLVGISTGRAHSFGKALKKGAKVVAVDVRQSEIAAKADKFLKIKPGTDLALVLAMLHVILHEKHHGENLYSHNEEFLKFYTNAPHLVVKMPHPVTKQPTWWLLSDKDGMIWWKNFYVWDNKENTLAMLQGYSNHNKKDIRGNDIDPALELDEEKRSAILSMLKKKNPYIEDVKTVWELLKEKTKSYTPEWAEKITTIPAKDIREVAIEFATNRPSVVEPGIYDARYANTIQLRKALTLMQVIINGHDNLGGYIVGGEFRHKVAKFWNWLNKEGFNKIGGKYVKFPLGYPVYESKYPAFQMPGVFWMLDYFFGIVLPNAQNPKAVGKFLSTLDYTDLVKSGTRSGYPNVSVLKSFKQWVDYFTRKSQEPGVAFPVFSDYGFEDAFEGKLKWNGKEYRPKVIFGYAVNPVLGSPYGDKWKKWMKEADLVVFLDTMPTDSNAYADVILPDQTYLERDDLILPRGTSYDLTVFKRVPAIDKPRGTSKHAVDFYFEMAAGMIGFQLLRMGKVKNQQEAMQKGAEVYIDFISKLNGWNSEKLKRYVFEAMSKREPFTKGMYRYQLEELSKEIGIPKEKLEKELLTKGFYNIEKMDELLEKWKIPEKLPTALPSGRVELFSTIFEMVQGFFGYMPNWDPVCEWVPPRRKDSLEKDEFFVSHGKSPVFSHTGIHTIDNPLLVGVSKWKKLDRIYYRVWIHPKAAERLGIRDNDLIEVINTEDPTKKMKARAFITKWVREDTIFIPFNGGTEAPVRFAVKPPEAARHVDVLNYKVEPIISGYTRDEMTVKVKKANS